MNMNFNRFRVQSAIELEIGCTDLTKWVSYNRQFKEYKVNSSNRDRLISELKGDASDIYFKALFSLSDALSNISEGRHSWSVIKLYYAVFFFLRCSLATKKYAFLKNKGIYTLKLDINESPERRDLGKFNGEKISGDHKTTIATHIKLFEHSDILLSNSIEGLNVYDWFMELRNQVNYRERDFTEPLNKYFYSSVFDKNKIRTQVENYMLDDSYVYCFDEEHCSLAVPLKLALLVRDQLINFTGFTPLCEDKKSVIHDLLSSSKLNESPILTRLYCF